MITNMRIIVFIVLFIIHINADDEGYCGDFCTYRFIESSGTMIFIGYYETDI